MAVIGAASFVWLSITIRLARLAGCGGSLLFQNLVDFKYGWWSTIEAMDGYFLGAVLLPAALLGEPAGANIWRIKSL
jgi:hypothetical protein